MAGGWNAGSIVSKLELQKSKWDASVKSVKGDLKTLGGKIQANSAKFKSMGRGMTMAGGAIVASMGLMIKKYAQAGDEVHKMALRTGFATSTLSELKYAAEISGGSITSLEKGIKKMSKSLTDASIGLETYVRSFDRIGLSVEELMTLSPEDQFLKIAEGIASLESPTLRAATAQEIFGRAGTELLPLFAEGVDGMTALREKAKELGYSFDTEAAEGAARLVDAQTTLKTAISGLGISISQNLAPALSKLIEGLSNAIAKVSDWIKEHPKLTEIIAKAVLGIGALMTVLGPLVMMLPGIVVALPAIATGISAILGPLGAVTAAAIAAYNIVKKLAKAKEYLAKATKEAETAQHNFGQKLRKIADAAGLTRLEFAELTKKYKGNYTALGSAILKGKEGVKLQKAMAEQAKIGSKEWEKQQKSLKKLDEEGFKPLTVTIPEVMEKTKTWVDYIKDMGLKTVEEKADRVEELEGYVDDLSQAYADGKIDLDDYIEAVKTAKDEIKDLSTSVSTTALPAFRDMSGALDSAVGEMTDRIPDITTAVETETGNVTSFWDTMADGLQTKWSSTIGEVLRGATSLKDGLKGIWDAVLTQFTDMVGQMVAKFIAENVFSLMTSAAKEVGTAIVGNIGSAIGGITKGAEAAVSGVNLLGSVVSGAVSGLVSGLIGGKTDMDATNRELHNIWAEARNILQNVDNMKWNQEALKKIGWKQTTLLAQIKDSLKGGLGGMAVDIDFTATNNFLKQIRGNTALIREWTKRTFETLKGKSEGWATGFEGIVTQPIRPLIGEAGPEWVSVQPLSGGRSPSSSNVTVNNYVNLNGTIITDRDYTRKRMIPEMLSALEANFEKTKMKQILGIA